MEDKIFGYSWEETQKMQQGKRIDRRITNTRISPLPPTEEDIKLLKEKGIEWLKKGFFNSNWK